MIKSVGDVAGDVRGMGGVGRWWMCVDMFGGVWEVWGVSGGDVGRSVGDVESGEVCGDVGRSVGVVWDVCGLCGRCEMCVDMLEGVCMCVRSVKCVHMLESG